MIRPPFALALVAWFALSVGLLMIGASCGEVRPLVGSEQEHAAVVMARADSNARAADAAAIEAARLEALAQELERQAIATPTPELIRQAAYARVDAAVATAVAGAMSKQAASAADEARAAADGARKERDQDAAAADLRWWVNVTRWIGLAGVGAGALIGGLMTWLISPKIGAPAGGIVAGTGILVFAFGATATWLPLVLAGTVVAALIAWAIYHARHRDVAVCSSRVIDAIEAPLHPYVAQELGEAKDALGAAVDRSGLRKRLTALRGVDRLWGRKVEA